MVAQGQKYTIIDMTVIPSAEPGRIGKKDAIITYRDAAMRTRVVSIPYEKLEGKSEEEQLAIITEAIKAMESERSRFVGKEITL